MDRKMDDETTGTTEPYTLEESHNGLTVDFGTYDLFLEHRGGRFTLHIFQEQTQVLECSFGANGVSTSAGDSLPDVLPCLVCQYTPGQFACVECPYDVRSLVAAVHDGRAAISADGSGPGNNYEVTPRQAVFLKYMADMEFMAQFTNGTVLLRDARSPYHPYYALSTDGRICSLDSYFGKE